MDACATRYASGEKARQVLGFEAEVGLEECVRESCAVRTPVNPRDRYRRKRTGLLRFALFETTNIFPSP